MPELLRAHSNHSSKQGLVGLLLRVHFHSWALSGASREFWPKTGGKAKDPRETPLVQQTWMPTPLLVPYLKTYDKSLKQRREATCPSQPNWDAGGRQKPKSSVPQWAMVRTEGTKPHTPISLKMAPIKAIASTSEKGQETSST